MGRVVEVPADAIAWPERCCCCAGKTFDWRPFSEKVVVWTVLSVTKYRVITLQVPLCDPCANRSRHWFVGAGVAGLLGYALASLGKGPAVGLMLPLFVAAVVCAILGVRAKPLKILGYDADKETLKLEVRDERISGALMRQVGARVASR